MFQLSVRCEKGVAARHYAAICKQLLNANDINRFRQVVLDLLQDGACNDFFENISENSIKRDLSNATTFNPPLFSLVDTFKCASPKIANPHIFVIELQIANLQISPKYCTTLLQNSPKSRLLKRFVVLYTDYKLDHSYCMYYMLCEEK